MEIEDEDEYSEDDYDDMESDDTSWRIRKGSI